MARTIKKVHEEKGEHEELTEEKDIYSEEGIQEMRDESQLSDWEAGFMSGAAGGGSGAKCRECGKIFTAEDRVVEREIGGERHLFCSEEHAEEYLEKRKADNKGLFKDYEH